MDDQESRRRQLAQALDRIDARRKVTDLRDTPALQALAAEIKQLILEVEALEGSSRPRHRRADVPES
jgi:hypothetical protein